MTNSIDTAVDSGNTAATRQSIILRLLCASALMLFLELALIRWLGSNIVHLSYFSNFVLLGSFLGIGAGFLISRKSWSAWRYSMPLLAMLIVGVMRFPVSIEGTSDEIIYFTSLHLSGPPAIVVLPLVFLMVAAILAGPAEIVGRCFPRLEPLSAYRYDLLGSLAGIVAFSLLSFAHAPPIVWGVVVGVLALYLASPGYERLLFLACTAIICTLLTMETLQPGTSWSPYYKLRVDEPDPSIEGMRLISANGVPHQLMAPAQWKLTEGEKQYGTPYLRLPENALGDVLIVGAGSGSDVAIALSNGARHVDAVDIDPLIMNVGRQYNVDRPYQSDRVTTHVNDGRAFLQSTDKKYDLILFALPDSLTLVNGASQIRLESFLFTAEAMQSVHAHLKPDGAFAMYNYYREPWLIDRLANTVKQAFGHEPCVDLFAGAQAVITIAQNPAMQACASPHQTAATALSPATDNAPFLYYRGGSLPTLYWVTLGAILVLSMLVVRTLGGPFSGMRTHLDLFFMGAAFLLLETKNVASFALLFGTTWFVNALVFAGILVVVLCAVEVTRRFRTPSMAVVFAGIALSLVAAWLVRPEWLLALPFWPRFAAASTLAFLPIFLANVAFSKRFADSEDSQGAFALNLLGALLGGCLEYAALLTGYANLLIVVGLFYLLAFVLLSRKRVAIAG